MAAPFRMDELLRLRDRGRGWSITGLAKRYGLTEDEIRSRLKEPNPAAPPPPGRMCSCGLPIEALDEETIGRPPRFCRACRADRRRNQVPRPVGEPCTGCGQHKVFDRRFRMCRTCIGQVKRAVGRDAA